MGKEYAIIEKRKIKRKSNKDQMNVDDDTVLQRVEEDDAVEKKKRKKKDKEKKKNEDLEFSTQVDTRKKGANEGQVVCVYGEDTNVDALGNVPEEKKRKDKNKRENETTYNAKFQVGNSGEVNVDEEVPEEHVSEVKSKEAMKKESSQSGTRKQEDVVDKVERKKRKREEKNKVYDREAGMSSKLDDDSIASRTVRNENGSVEMSETFGLGQSENSAEKIKTKKKKKKMEVSKIDVDCLLVPRQGDVPESVDVTVQSEHNGNVPYKRERKKSEKKQKDDLSAQQGNVHNNSNAFPNTDAARDYVVYADKGKKKKAKLVENVPTAPTSSKRKKKVRFSGVVEVFRLPDDSDLGSEEEKMVRGQRFTREENEIVKAAVYKYIKDRHLGEKGLDMVLNSSKHPEVKGCWREIAASIPYRPYKAIYNRAQIMFRSSEKHTWTEEECEMVRKHQEQHGNEWKALADELGRHRWHVRDTWRRIKLPNLNKGHWSQKEYQQLFNLVNIDLQLRVSEEKHSKHGMLRDNISWTAISDRAKTRSHATCCFKWYGQLTSPMVVQGVWADADDNRLLGYLYNLDANCMEDVDWDNVIGYRSGDLCRKRWHQMVLHIGQHVVKSFSEQVEVLAQRYCPNLIEARETWDSKPRVLSTPKDQEGRRKTEGRRLNRQRRERKTKRKSVFSKMRLYNRRNKTDCHTIQSCDHQWFIPPDQFRYRCSRR